MLDAAKHVFARSGVDAPVREIASAAGVGIATLYRRFPSRAELVAAVFRREVDACAIAAERLEQDYPPFDALAEWLLRYAQFIAAKQGLGAALHSGDPAFEALPAYFRARFEPALARLLDAAAAAGEAREGVDPHDLLRAVGNLSVTGDDGLGHTDRMVRLLVDGLRWTRKLRTQESIR